MLLNRGQTRNYGYQPDQDQMVGQFANSATYFSQANNPYEEYLGPVQQPGELFDPQMRRSMITDLEQAYRGPNAFVEKTLIRTFTDAQTFMTRDILPWSKLENTNTIQWQELKFLDDTLDVLASEGVPRRMGFERTKRSATLQTYGKGLQVPYRFWATPEGQETWLNQLKQIANATIETANFSAAEAILTCKQPADPSMIMFGEDNPVDLLSRLQNEIKVFGILHEKTGFITALNLARGEIQARTGKDVTDVIVPFRAVKQIQDAALNPQGPVGTYSVATSNARIHESRAYRMNSDYSMDPHERTSSIGAFALMSPKRVAMMGVGKPVHPSAYDMRIWNESTDNFQRISIMDAIQKCGIWEKGGYNGITALGQRYFGYCDTWNRFCHPGIIRQWWKSFWARLRLITEHTPDAKEATNMMKELMVYNTNQAVDSEWLWAALGENLSSGSVMRNDEFEGNRKDTVHLEDWKPLRDNRNDPIGARRDPEPVGARGDVRVLPGNTSVSRIVQLLSTLTGYKVVGRPSSSAKVQATTKLGSFMSLLVHLLVTLRRCTTGVKYDGFRNMILESESWQHFLRAESMDYQSKTNLDQLEELWAGLSANTNVVSTLTDKELKELLTQFSVVKLTSPNVTTYKDWIAQAMKSGKDVYQTMFEAVLIPKKSTPGPPTAPAPPKKAPVRKGDASTLIEALIPTSFNLPLFCARFQLPMPAGFLLFVPHQQWRTGTMVALNRENLGNTYHGHSAFMVSVNTTVRLIKGTYIINMRPLVHEPDQVEILRDAMIVKYIRGFNTAKHFDAQNEAHVTDYKNGTTRGRSLFFCLVPPQFEPESSALSLTGQFPWDLPDSLDSGETGYWPGAEAYSIHWGWENPIDPYATAFHPEEGSTANVVCYRTTEQTLEATGTDSGQWLTTHVSRGHLKRHIYPGSAQVRNGSEPFYDKIDYNYTR